MPNDTEKTTKEHLNWTADLLIKCAGTLRNYPTAADVAKIADIMLDFHQTLLILEYRVRIEEP